MLPKARVRCAHVISPAWPPSPVIRGKPGLGLSRRGAKQGNRDRGGPAHAKRTRMDAPGEAKGSQRGVLRHVA